MGKVFGYPVFDENGEKILTTYDNEYSEMRMDIRVYRMKKGEERSFLRKGEETAILLLSGKIRFCWDGKETSVSRKDVFTQGPWCLHICTEAEAAVKAEEDSEILVLKTKQNSQPCFTARRMRPGNIPAWVNSGMWPKGVSIRSSTMTSHPGPIWCWERCSMTGATGPVICRTGIRSRKPIISCLAGPKGSVPALWEIRCLRVRTGVFPPYREGSCIPRPWRRAFRCIPAG